MVSERWLPVSPVSGRIDAFEWKVPVERLQPLVEHVVEEAEPAAPVIEMRPDPEPHKLEPVAAVIVEAPKAEPEKPVSLDNANPKKAKVVDVVDMMPMIPDDPGVRAGDPAGQPKRFRLF
jgi:HemY protein